MRSGEISLFGYWSVYNDLGLYNTHHDSSFTEIILRKGKSFVFKVDTIYFFCGSYLHLVLAYTEIFEKYLDSDDRIELEIANW